jgi:hypothetical protein
LSTPIRGGSATLRGAPRGVRVDTTSLPRTAPPAGPEGPIFARISDFRSRCRQAAGGTLLDGLHVQLHVLMRAHARTCKPPESPCVHLRITISGQLSRPRANSGGNSREGRRELGGGRMRARAALANAPGPGARESVAPSTSTRLARLGRARACARAAALRREAAQGGCGRPGGAVCALQGEWCARMPRCGLVGQRAGPAVG